MDHSRLQYAFVLSFILFLVQINASFAQETQGFFRAEGTEILNGDGEPVLLRGVGLGGWLMPEGYMLHMPGFGSPTSIRQMIEDLIGTEDTDEFYRRYESNYVAEKDIEAIASWGFDHIRLPFHYNVFYSIESDSFNEEGFALLDRFLEWCKTYGLYVILDMHAAPGAQSIHNIADSDGVARLWTEPDPYQDLTVKIWTEIASRYADETQIIGYDLINEPVTPEEIEDGAQALRDLYVRLTEAIRPIDPNHILFIEGNFFATTFDKLTPPFDDNMVYAFHKYWNAPDQGSIQYLINLREQHQTPLWLGESGENSNAWFYATVQLMERNNIGWNWWTHKKINTLTSPLSAPFSEGYQGLIEYWNGQSPKPSADSARQILFELADNLAIDSTSLRSPLLKALFDPSYSHQLEPFKEHRIPGVINAVDYDIGNNGSAYQDTDPMAISGFPGLGNTGGQYRNDGVDIERSTDPEGFEYNIGWIEFNEWTKYTVDIDQAGIYDIEFRVASAVGGNGSISLSLETTRTLGTTPPIPNTGGWQNWITTSMTGVELPAGRQIVNLSFGTGGFNVNRITFRLITATDNEEPSPQLTTRLLSHYPNPTTDELYIQFENDNAANVQLKVYNVLGQEVHVSPLQPFLSGTHTLTYLSNHLAPGLYLYQLSLDNGHSTTYLTDQFVIQR